MAEETSERRVIITILLVSTLLTMLGVAGLIMGTYDLSLEPIPADARELYGPEADAITVEMFEARVSNPYRRPMAAANVVVSGLVLIGSFMLSWRRKLAQWWIRQAVTAKLIWIVAYTATMVTHIEETFPREILEQVGAPLSAITGILVTFGVISGTLHVAAAYRATRPDIGQFIEAAAQSRS